MISDDKWYESPWEGRKVPLQSLGKTPQPFISR